MPSFAPTRRLNGNDDAANVFLSRALMLRRSLPDVRDYKFETLLAKVQPKPPQTAPPSSFILPYKPAVYDQGHLGSCTANSGAGAFQIDLMKQNLPAFVPSRLFVYYNEREVEGTVSQDCGADLRTLLKVMQTALCSGFPIIFGMCCYPAMLSLAVSRSGMLPMPAPNDQLQGLHAVLIVGFDSNKVALDGSKGMFLVRNSWGSGWGQSGHFWIPFAYVTNPNLCFEFFVINLVK